MEGDPDNLQAPLRLGLYTPGQPYRDLKMAAVSTLSPLSSRLMILD